MTIIFIFILCAFFTVLALFRPNIMWGLLSAVAWMLMFWWTRSNPLAGTVTGDFGDTAIIGICIGAASFILIYTTIRVRDAKQKEDDKEMGENSPIGTREKPDDYYNRLNRLTHPKK